MVKNKINDEIVKNAQAGDTDAYSQIYHHYYKKIYFIAYDYFHDEELARDIVQETMLGVYRNISSLSSPSAIHTWILSICHRKCMDEIRKRKFEYVYVNEEDNDIIKNLPSPNNSNILNENELKEIIISALEKMSFPLKSVGLLRFYEELSIPEISEILEIPEGTVKSRIHKIKQHLQSELRKKEITPTIYASHTAIPSLIVAAYLSIEKQAIKTVVIENPLFIMEATKNISKTILLKIFAFLTGSLLLGSITYILFMNKPTEKITDTPVESAKITDISYNKELTRENIILSIKTSNNEYDEICINGGKETEIKENGEYIIEIWKDNKVIDKQIIQIHNIDKTSPELLSALKDDSDKCTLIFFDENGIDYNNFEFYKNGILNKDYTLDKESNSISFKGNLDTIYYIKVRDRVGNPLNTKVFLEIE